MVRVMVWVERTSHKEVQDVVEVDPPDPYLLKFCFRRALSGGDRDSVGRHEGEGRRPDLRHVVVPLAAIGWGGG